VSPDLTLMCPVEGCDKPSRYQRVKSDDSTPGLCGRCQKAKREGRLGKFRKELKAKICSVSGCDKTQYALELCNMHWQREKNFGFTGTAEPMKVDWLSLGLTKRPSFIDNRKDDVPDTLEGILLRDEYESILKKDPCSYCGGAMQAIDHIQPYSREGSSEWDNLTAACTSCNSRKGNWTLLEFMLKERTSVPSR
jgi:hypothetical protein